MQKTYNVLEKMVYFRGKRKMRSFLLGKINGNDAANGARHLVHKAAGLAEKLVFRVLCNLGNLHVADRAVVVKVVLNVADHILKGGGRGKSRALQNA